MYCDLHKTTEAGIQRAIAELSKSDSQEGRARIIAIYKAHQQMRRDLATLRAQSYEN